MTEKYTLLIYLDLKKGCKRWFVVVLSAQHKWNSCSSYKSAWPPITMLCPLWRFMGSSFPHTDAIPLGFLVHRSSCWNDLPWNIQTVQLIQLNTRFLFSLSHICLDQLDNYVSSAFWSYFKGSYTNILSHYITLLQDINFSRNYFK